jgi:hypothetical protein
VTDRLASLTDGDPRAVYSKNRGQFLTYTIDVLLPQFPLGAGLGRWGMINAYFGDNRHPERSGLWAEIQWTAWLFDGGVPLIAAYVMALLMALRGSFKLTRLTAETRRNDLWLWATLVCAYNVGAIAMTFSYPLFASQAGLEFWVLNGVLVGCVAAARTPAAPGSLRAG